jgi:predicted NAD-dependent protein-ADP-ribosyltransferase YbiA (DUF1768 family)
MKEIVLGQEERYNAAEDNCWGFCKGTDVRDGIALKFGNMLTDFPFECHGVNFKCSEMLYLCGQYSNNTEECIDIQHKLCECNNGFSAKKFIRNKYIEQTRYDFNDFRIQWMLWVVWQKVKGNKDFQQLLLSLPHDAVIIEDSSWQTSPTATVWGCKNCDLKKARQNLKKDIETKNSHLRKKDIETIITIETNKINKVGIYIGQNNMGKILMLCRQALIENKEPSINYDVLKRYNIYLFGERLF